MVSKLSTLIALSPMQLSPELIKRIEDVHRDYQRRHFVVYNPDFEMFLRDIKVSWLLPLPLAAVWLPMDVKVSIASDRQHRLCLKQLRINCVKLYVATGGSGRAPASTARPGPHLPGRAEQCHWVTCCDPTLRRVR